MSTHAAEDDNSKYRCNFANSEAASAKTKAKEEKRHNEWMLVELDFNIKHWSKDRGNKNKKRSTLDAACEPEAQTEILQSFSLVRGVGAGQAGHFAA